MSWCSVVEVISRQEEAWAILGPLREPETWCLCASQVTCCGGDNNENSNGRFERRNSRLLFIYLFFYNLLADSNT